MGVRSRLTCVKHSSRLSPRQYACLVGFCRATLRSTKEGILSLKIGCGRLVTLRSIWRHHGRPLGQLNATPFIECTFRNLETMHD